MLGKFSITLISIFFYLKLIDSAPQQQPKHVIVDIDAGIDDYQALVFLLNAQKRRQIKIAAIILTDGNTALDDVKVNVCRLLEMMNVKKIPIYAGSSHPILNAKKLDNHFGHDGFGDLQLKKKPNLDVINDTLAPTAIADMVKLRPGFYDYIALAPLTNLALAMTMYKNVPKEIGQIYIMGGNFGADSGAEFNFLGDPESANIVFKEVLKPVTLFTYQACINKEMTIGWRFGMEDQVEEKNNAVWNLNNMAEKKLWGNWDHDLGYQSCDPILISMMLEPELITDISFHKADVQLCDDDRAKVSVEDATEDDANVKMIHGFDADAYQEVFVREFNKVCKNYKCNNSFLQ